jgi:methionyl-tRNA synthetase C-terminal region/beta chain
MPPVPNIEDEIAHFEGLEPGTQVAEGSNLFPRIEVKKEGAQEIKGQTKEQKAQKKNQDKAQDSAQCKTQEKSAPSETASAVAADVQAASIVKPNVEFEQFKALDLRVGTVKTAEKHPNADRILRLEIDFGEGEPRQILSGLAEHYAPEDIVGKKVCAVLNLAPRKIRGLVSHGMVLTAGTDNALGLLAVDRDVPDGSEIA